jgi:opacity protein-like surface antigen
VNLALTAPTGGAMLGTPATAALSINATTPVPVTPPPVSNTVTVTAKGGGGAVGAWEVLLLGALLLVQVLRSRRFVPKSIEAAMLCCAVLSGAIGFAPHANADSPQVYAGFGLGQARSVASAADLQRKLDADGFPGASVTLDDRKLAGKLYAGLSLNQYFSFEAAYVDLNKVRTRSTATTTDAADFIAAVTAIHPYSARGGAFTALASRPLVGGLAVFARGGGFVWHGEIDADIPAVAAAETKKTGLSGVVGAGLDFAFTRHFALRAEWERYFLSRDSMDLLTAGLRFSF